MSKSKKAEEYLVAKDLLTRKQCKDLKKMQANLREKGYTLQLVPPAPGQKVIDAFEFEIVPLRQ